MTYKVAGGKTPRRTWDSSMFARNAPLSAAGVGLPSPTAQHPPPQQPMAQSFHPQAVQEDLWAQQQAAQQQQQWETLHQQQQLILAQQQQLLQAQAAAQVPQPHSSPPNIPQQPWNGEQQAPQPLESPPAPTAPTFSHMDPVPSASPPAKPAPPADPTKDPANSSPGVGFIVGDSAEERRKNEEMENRRKQLLEAQLRRKAQAETKKAEAEAEAARRRANEEAKEKAAEERKRREAEKRARLFEAYKEKKAAEDDDKGPPPGPATPRIARGHSQPPRPKSQVIQRRPVPGGGGENGSGPGSLEQLNRLNLPDSLAEPTHKLFVKPTAKSNRGLILNSINYCVLAGGVHRETREKVLAELAKSEAKHFLVLFRDGNRMQFRGLYSWDEVGDTAHKLCGTGPKIAPETIMHLMFKYDSGAKQFQNVPTRHLSATIDGFTIKDEFWAKKKGPYATAASARRASNF